MYYNYTIFFYFVNPVGTKKIGKRNAFHGKRKRQTCENQTDISENSGHPETGKARQNAGRRNTGKIHATGDGEIRAFPQKRNRRGAREAP